MKRQNAKYMRKGCIERPHSKRTKIYIEVQMDNKFSTL